MRLLLMRHGEAVPGRDSDPDRSLTEFGRAAFSRPGDVALAALAEVKQVWSSPWLRARQTAALLAPYTAARAVVETDLLLPSADPVAVLQQLELSELKSSELELSAEDTLLLVAHQPFVGKLAALLCDGPVAHPWAFSPADLAVIELDWPAAGLGLLRRWHRFPG